jgi:hypothetical protein
MSPTNEKASPSGERPDEGLTCPIIILTKRSKHFLPIYQLAPAKIDKPNYSEILSFTACSDLFSVA